MHGIDCYYHHLMTPNFINSVHCGKPGLGLRAHCSQCLEDGKWRAFVGAPDVCPWDVTPEIAAYARAALKSPISNPNAWPLGTWLSRIIEPIILAMHRQRDLIIFIAMIGLVAAIVLLLFAPNLPALCAVAGAWLFLCGLDYLSTFDLSNCHCSARIERLNRLGARLRRAACRLDALLLSNPFTKEVRPF